MSKIYDVSKWQRNIAFKEAASCMAGVIIRAGFGRYSHQIDPFFIVNYDGFREEGLPIGVYWYGYAVTPAEAADEARVCLEALKGRELQLPLYYDQEETTVPQEQRLACAVEFCSYIEEHSNYMPGYYSYTEYMRPILCEQLRKHARSIWQADWRALPSLLEGVDLHQYTNTATCPGITGRVDCSQPLVDLEQKVADYTRGKQHSKPKTAEELLAEILAALRRIERAIK